MTAEKIIEKLKEYRKDGLIIIGPQGHKEKKLRIYAGGGSIGKIALRGKGKCEINQSENYVENHLFIDGSETQKDSIAQNELRKFFEEARGKKEDDRSCGEILCDPHYIELMLKATRHFGYKYGKNSVYQGKRVKRERLIETTLIAQQGEIKCENGNLLVYDMEYALTCPTNSTTKNGKKKKHSKPDFMVFDGQNIGFVELKYDAENMSGDGSLGVHYSDFMDFIWNSTEEYNIWDILDETIYRLECLKDANLLDISWYTGINNIRLWYNENRGKDNFAERIWIGFFFVEGPHKKRRNKEYKMVSCRDYIQDEIQLQLGKAMKEEYKKGHCTQVRFGYWEDDDKIKMIQDKEIVLDEKGTIRIQNI